MSDREVIRQMAARMNAMNALTEWWVFNGCPPIEKVRNAHNSLQMMKAVRIELSGHRVFFVNADTPTSTDTALTENRKVG